MNEDVRRNGEWRPITRTDGKAIGPYAAKILDQHTEILSLRKEIARLKRQRRMLAKMMAFAFSTGKAVMQWSFSPAEVAFYKGWFKRAAERGME